MNDGTDDQMLPADHDGDDPAVDALVDAELRGGAERLRAATPEVSGSDVMVGSLRRRLYVTRRWNVAGGVATAVLAVSLVAALMAGGSPGGGGGKHDGGRPPTLAAPDVGDAAVELVDSLPAQPVDPHNVRLVASVSRYDTCDSLLDELHRVGAEHVGSMGFGGFYGMPYGSRFASSGYLMDKGVSAAIDGELVDEAAAPGGGDSMGGGAGSGETLGTNVVVDGVDEMDSVKAVGNLIVDLADNQLRIVDTRTATITSTLELRPPEAIPADPDDPDPDAISAWVHSMVVDDTNVIVFGSEMVPTDAVVDDPSATRPPLEYMTVTFVDISDPSAPRIVDRARIEGGLVTVRRVGSSVRMVTRSSLADLPLVMPTTAPSVPVALRSNRLMVAGSTVADWIPDWDNGEGTATRPLVDCGDVVVPDTFAGVEMTSLVEFATNGPFAPRATSILAPSEDLTANQSDVVVASHVWVDPAQRTGDFEDWSTALHRFTFEGTGPSYVASGTVPGSVRDQFSLSVLDDDHISAVTVDQLPWNDRAKAKVHVRVLASDESDHTMGEVGATVPPRSGGVVSSVRYVGERVLLTSGLLGNVMSIVDLSDPGGPTTVGDVDLGASGGYIHPIDDGRVLVLGRTIRNVGRQVRYGTAAVIVDLAAARIDARWERDDAYTDVAGDHHSFTWWPQRSIAAFGFNTASYGSSSTPPEAAFLTVGDHTVEPRIVRPRDIDRGLPSCEPNWVQGCDETGYPYVQRVLVVEGTPWLYTTETLESLDPDTLAPGRLIDILVPR